MAFFGEVGLSGELRAVSQLEARLKEAAKLGFKRCVLPPLASIGKYQRAQWVGDYRCRTLHEAVEMALIRPAGRRLALQYKDHHGQYQPQSHGQQQPRP